MATEARTKSFRKDLILILGLSFVLLGAMIVLRLVDGDQSIVSGWSSEFFRNLFRL